MYTRSTELFHAGTKGMKWGRRLYQNKDGSLTALGRMRYGKGKGKGKTKAELEKEKAKAAKKAAKAEAKESEKKAKKLEKKSYLEMTDEELKKQTARLQLEKNYRDLYVQMRPEKNARAKKLVSNILEKSAENIGTQTVTYALGTLVNKFGEQITGDSAIVNPKKGQKDK